VAVSMEVLDVLQEYVGSQSHEVVLFIVSIVLDELELSSEEEWSKKVGCLLRLYRLSTAHEFNDVK